MPSKPTVNDSFFPPLDDDFTYEEAWTTSAFLDLPSAQFMNLSDDDVLGVHRVNRQLTHSVVTLPSPPNDDGREQKAWEAFYPAGSANPRGDIPGGFGFYMHGPEAFAQRLATEDVVEMAIGYSVLFPDDWEWVKGGKLPGIFGGLGNSAYGCTGGRQTDRENCFNLRLMWRQSSLGELYAYIPLTENNRKHLLAVPPRTIANPDFGFSVGRGSFTFRTATSSSSSSSSNSSAETNVNSTSVSGQQAQLKVNEGGWNMIWERVKLNTIGQEDGEVEVRVNGKQVILATNLTLRSSPEAKIQGLHFETFFGGKGPDWASPKDQHAWFADVTGAIIVRKNES
ncbi:hypothetical protein SCHPADRAFT_911425 [Schizopora paradoxa]|uniref:Polysaccharide lyase 14 domain-containing protein n=1 Tax=Schizopora paradoxa TaxID=27342 RepID=A0A0H2R0N9_9AGAM|nr:hypothetical protein SCHPADRAFT_911425 [Schizopora paradoxa]